MNLNQLHTLLEGRDQLGLRILLPHGSSVPLSFHVTEVGLVRKTFLDCGGTLRETTTCQLQVWVGEDVEHRLEAGKLAAILRKAAFLFPDDTVPVEFEYEDKIISQYTVEATALAEDSVVFRLGVKHTDCLAKEKCGLPATPSNSQNSCCAGSGCC